MGWQNYFLWLLVLSLFVAILEFFFARKPIGRFRKGFLSDLGWLVFNGEIFGIFLAAVFFDLLPFSQATLPEWLTPFWIQFVFVFVMKDFLDYWVHILLHRIDWLWQFHRLHHSAVQMDFLICFRFHFMETIVYKTVAWAMFFLLGLDPKPMFLAAVLSTLIGHLNHANLDWSYGPLGYIFNNPRFHIWHHEAVKRPEDVGNFALNLSLWDHIFRTARNPEGEPVLGLPESHPSECHLSLLSRLVMIGACFFWLWQSFK